MEQKKPPDLFEDLASKTAVSYISDLREYTPRQIVVEALLSLELERYPLSMWGAVVSYITGSPFEFRAISDLARTLKDLC